jgi:preprotein translocase subunit SecY
MFSIYPLALKSYEEGIESYESFKYDWILTILITCFVLGFAITIGPLTWLYLAEIMTEIGMGIAVSINWLIVICISYLPSLASTITTEVGKPYQQNDVSPFFFIFGG